MKKSLLVLVISTLMSSANASSVIESINYQPGTQLFTKTDGYIAVKDQTVRKDVISSVIANSYVKVTYQGTGCRNIDFVIDMYAEKMTHHEKLYATVCPGTTEYKIKTETKHSYKEGKYPVSAKIVWSAVGENPTRTSTAILTVV